MKKLTPENYFEPWARRNWLSSSDIKAFHRCEAAWVDARERLMRGEFTDEHRPEFTYGHIFERLACGEVFSIPEEYSDTVTRTGKLRSEFANVEDAARKVRGNAFLREIIDSCKKQVVMTGHIDDIPVRIMVDLLAPDGSIYDLKSMRDFAQVRTPEGELVDWWDAWDYPMQLSVYREIARQNGLEVPHVGLIAVSKTDLDVDAVEFGAPLMQAADADVAYTIQRLKLLSARVEEPLHCGHCHYCVAHKSIRGFRIV